MRRSRVQITSPDHAGGLGLYGIQIALGVAYILDLAEAKSMITLTNSFTADAWALILLLGGLTAIMGALNAKAAPPKGMRVEMWACVVIAAASFIYEATLVIGNGWNGVVTTQILSAGVGASCALRALQVLRERRKVISVLSEVA